MSERTVFLFTTPFCALCPGTKKKLELAGIEFEAVNAIQEAKFTQSLNIRSVPHVVVIEGPEIDVVGSKNKVLYSQGGTNQDIEKIKEILTA